MRPEDFTEDAPGDVEMVDGVFSFSPDSLPPEIEPTHDLVTAHGEAMYSIGRLADLEVWLDTPEIILSPLIHREATESSNIETTTRATLSDLYRREAGLLHPEVPLLDELLDRAGRVTVIRGC